MTDTGLEPRTDTVLTIVLNYYSRSTEAKISTSDQCSPRFLQVATN